MNTDVLSVALSHVEHLVHTLSKHNLRLPNQESSVLELVNRLVSNWGGELEVHLLRCVLSSAEFLTEYKRAVQSRSSSSVGSSSGDPSSQQALLLNRLFHQWGVVRVKAGFLSNFCQAYDRPLKPITVDQQLSIAALCKICRFNAAQEVLLGLSLIHSSAVSTQEAATDFLKSALPRLFQAYSDPDTRATGLQDCSVETVHLILSSLSEDPNCFGVLPELKKAFLNTLKRDFPADGVPAVLLPWLSSSAASGITVASSSSTTIADQTQTSASFESASSPSAVEEEKAAAIDFKSDMDLQPNLAHAIAGSLPEKIREIGYAFTVSDAQCEKQLTQLVDGNVTILNPMAIARILSMMVQTHNALRNGIPLVQASPEWAEQVGNESQATSWNTRVFARTVNKMYGSNFSWHQVVVKLDHPGFYIADREGLELLVNAVLEGLGSDSDGKPAPFPVPLLYRTWNFHKEGQLSFILRILENLDLFNLSNLSYRPVECSVLKTQSDDSSHPQLANWKNLDLIDILQKLSETPGLTAKIAEALNYPVQNCPDVLFLGLLQLPPPMNDFRRELITTLVPMFLGNHPNAIAVLSYGWNCQLHNVHSLRLLIVQSMASWFLKHPGDQSKLSRLLEIVNDLKPEGVTMLLSLPNHHFTIDLACLASKREYIKLEKWISDKIQEHGESFVSASAAFLKRRLSSTAQMTSVVGAAPSAQQPPLPAEVTNTFLSCLTTTQVSTSVATSLANEILQLATAWRTLQTKPTATGVLPATTSVGAVAPPASSSSTLPSVIGGPSSGRPTSSGYFDTTVSGTMPPGINPPPPGHRTPTLPGTTNPNTGGVPPGSLFGGISSSNSAAAGGVTTVGPFGKPPQHQQGRLDLFSNPARSALFPPRTGADMQSSTNPYSAFGIGPSSGGAGQGGALRTTPSSSSLQGGVGQLPPLSSLDRSMKTGAFGGLEPSSAAGTAPPPSSHTPPTLGQPADNFQPDLSQTFPEEIQSEANQYFQQIYTQPPNVGMSVSAFVAKMKEFSTSRNEKEKQVFGCMLKNLFEEYRFFSGYPDRELFTTAEVYGGLIREGVISYILLATALKYVLSALSHDPGSKLFRFGIAALEACKNRLREYPRLCACIVNLAHFGKFPSHIVEYVNAGTSGQTPASVTGAAPPSTLGGATAAIMGRSTPNQETEWLRKQKTDAAAKEAEWTSGPAGGKTPVDGIQGASDSGKPVKGPSIVSTSTNIRILEKATEAEENKVKEPPERVSEKVAFLFNNLSQVNLQMKVEEMKGILCDDRDLLLPWLSQYLIMKRVSIEPNFHALYSNFVSALCDCLFEELIKTETHRNIRILLKSDKRQAIAKFGDRTLLKNLGHWLGLITIAKDKPILIKDLDLKCLIMEAYYKGQQELLYVIPFTAKILESCAKSRVFAPQSAWVMSIMRLLAELHDEPDMKLNLKFEIEVLCKDLHINLREIEVTGILKDTDRLYAAIKNRPQLDEIQSLDQLESSGGASGLTSGGPLGGGGGLHGSQSPLHAHGAAHHSAYHTAAGGDDSNASIAQFGSAASFSYNDICVTNFQGLSSHIKINDTMQLFQLYPHMKHCVRPALEHAVKDLIGPMCDRSIKLAMQATDNLIKKDFALNPEEGQMRSCAHAMMRSMTAAMAHITSREALMTTLQNNLKNSFIMNLRGGMCTNEHEKLFEEAARTVSEDNFELAQCFIEKSACERSLSEIDKRLEQQLNYRIGAKREGKLYADPEALQRAETLPEAIRPTAGSLSAQQLATYEAFTQNICGFKPATADELACGGFTGSTHSASSVAAATVVAGTAAAASQQADAVEYQAIMAAIDQYQSTAPQSSKAAVALRGIKEALLSVGQSQRGYDANSAAQMVQKVVDLFLATYHMQTNEPEWMLRLREIFMKICQQVYLSFGADLLKKSITQYLIECRQEYRFNLDVVVFLISNNLIQLPNYDAHLAEAMETGMNFSAVQFAQRLAHKFVMEEGGRRINQSDLALTLQSLSKMSLQSSRMQPDGTASNLLDILEPARAPPSGSADVPSLIRGPRVAGANNVPGGASAVSSSGVIGGAAVTTMAPSVAQLFAPADQNDDPPELVKSVEHILREWLNVCYSPISVLDPSQALAQIVNMMHEHGILRTDEMISRFFRIAIEMCVDYAYKMLQKETLLQRELGVAQAQQRRAQWFPTLDAFVRMAALMVKMSDGTNVHTKLNLLRKVLENVTNLLLQDAEVRKQDFHQLPYHRILIQLFIELTNPDAHLDSIFVNIVEMFTISLVRVNPKRLPLFAYAWLDIVGHRLFIGRVLTHKDAKCGYYYTQLILWHLKFLAPYLRNIDLPKSVMLMYKGTLRVLLVLLHDFPELLCDYHYMLCDWIPPNCVQLRNLVLSAYPKQMRLPDPFMPNLKVDHLPEINNSPTIAGVELDKMIPADLKTKLDHYLEHRAPVSHISELPSQLQVSQVAGSKYLVSVMNAVVLYVGRRAIDAIQEKAQRINLQTIAHTAFMDCFQNLAVSLDTEGRYLFFNAIANQLRFPNSHTHYFSCCLLYLFLEANAEVIQEQITRVLFERLVALRPHPWGLLITFIELIKNPAYGFWEHEFVRCAPEIEKLFQSVAASCMSKQAMGDATPTGGVL